MAYEALWHEYMQMPVVTRAYTTACVITTLAVVSISRRFSFFFTSTLGPRALLRRRRRPASGRAGHPILRSFIPNPLDLRMHEIHRPS